MKYYIVEKKNEVQQIDTRNLTVEYLYGLKNAFSPVLYITDNGRYIGCVGQTEYCKYQEHNQVFINRNSTYIVSGKYEKEKAEKIFDQNPKIKKLPVLDNRGFLLYEYIRDYEKFYEILRIDCGINTEHYGRQEKIIVSLTSYGKRLETVHLTIKSIMYQTIKPDKIILYLDAVTGSCRIKYEDELIQAGLIIRRNVENLKPHKKYYYVMQEFEEALIITVDDDVIYENTLIERLYNKHLKYPEAVICQRGHRLKFQGSRLDLYENWEFCVKSLRPSFDICAIGVGGVLYPKGRYRKAFLNRKAILQTSLKADDLWLKVIEVLNDVKVYAIGEDPLLYIHDTQQEALKFSNLDQGENNIVLECLQNYLGIDLAEMLLERIKINNM